ncbi:MAG: iron chelate uptake ABC transporter family permease subunit [Lachnospiraceae bacterium]
MNVIFALFSDYTFQTVALGSALLGLISGVLGSFAVLRKQSLLGDGVSHSALPGVVMAFILLESKNTEILLLGALLSGLAATLFIVSIVRHTRIKFDSALALVMSVFFGLGLVLLTYVQKIPNSNQAGLKRFIFGQASTLLQRDIFLMVVCGVILLILVLLFWKEFKLFTFDADFAQSLGFSPQKLNLLLSFMIVVAIIIGLQTVGVILMSAMLITPAVAARQWTNRLWVMAVLSALFGGVSGVAGTAASSLVPKLPTGPAIVVCVSIIVVISILFAPGRGVLHRIYRRRRNRILYKLEGGIPNDSAN